MLDSPHTINPVKYENAYSPTLPRGVVQRCYNLRELVDPIPLLDRNYNPTGSSTESIYGLIINSASTTNAFVTPFLSQAKKAFEESKMVNLSGGPGYWQPVFAQPERWYDESISSLKHVSIDPHTMDIQGLEEDFTQLPIDQNSLVSWGLSTGTDIKALHKDSKIKSITCECLVVNLERPWIHPDLFSLKDWSIEGQDAGFISNGKLTDNTGLLPLLPVAMIVGHHTTIEADFHETDLQYIIKVLSAEKPLYLGPLPISLADIKNAIEQVKQNSSVLNDLVNNLEKIISQNSTPIFLLGFVSNLIPFCPPSTM